MEQKQKDYFRIKAHIALMNDNNEVFLLRSSGEKKWNKGFLGFPGGKVESIPGETPLMRALIEAKEEIGVDIDQSDVSLVLVTTRCHDDKDVDRNWMDFFFLTRKWSGDPRIMEHDKADMCGWFALNVESIHMLPHEKEFMCHLAQNTNQPIFSHMAWQEKHHV